MKSVNDLKTKDDIYEHFLISENHVKLNLKNSTMLKVKKTIKDSNVSSFLKLLEKILFVIRNDLKLNFNVREKYFTNMLKKHGIKFEIGDKYTRTIFFFYLNNLKFIHHLSFPFSIFYILTKTLCLKKITFLKKNF